MIGYTAGERLTITLDGRIDSNNAPACEQEIMKALEENPGLPVTVDCDNLTYISSAGLRALMKLKKAVSDTILANVPPQVYDIFETTGFTEIMDVRKQLRTISVEGCQVIGKGANGTVYRIDKETIVKTFRPGSDISDIDRERKLARTAFVMGIPTAISYDVVKIAGGGFGSVYELLDASNLAKELSSGRKTVDEIVALEVDLLKTIHSKEVNPDHIPPFRDKVRSWVDFDKDHIPADKYDKLCRLVDAIPHDNHMIHGDFHLKNIMFQNDECFLIDMDSLSHGNKVFEFANIWATYVGLGEVDPQVINDFLDFPYEQSVSIWKKTLELYFGTTDEKALRKIEDKARILGYARIIRRCIRKNRIATETGRKEYENAVANICTLLDRTDSLTL